MARPTKQGIDYFPVDTEFDDDLQLLTAEIGAEGIGILLTIWQAIYKDRGYYILWDKKFPLKIKQKCFSTVEIIVNAVENAIDYGIFDKDMYETYQILTSRGIQKRYFTAARAKKQIEIIPQYALIDVSGIENGIDVNINGIDVVGNATYVEVEVKEEVKEDVNVKEKGKKKKFTPPSLQQIMDYCTERNNSIDAETFLNFYTSKNWMIGKNKMADWKAAIRTWERKEKEYGEKTSDGATRDGARSDGAPYPVDFEA